MDLSAIISQKTTDAISNYLSKNWKRISIGMAGAIECVFGWFDNLPIAYQFPLILAVILLLTCIYLVIFWGNDRLLLSKRQRAIKRGAKIIFENKPSQFVLHIIKDWAGSADEPDVFNEERNYQRIKSDSDNGILKLTHSSLSENNIIDPVYQMTMEKTEFIRWLETEKELPVPRIW